MHDKMIVGVRETVHLPRLGLSNIVTRVDTGAKTSALHVDHIVVDAEEKIVKFEFHPDFHDVNKTIQCEATLHDTRWIKSSNGNRERRCIIKTAALIGTLEWEIELTLTNRANMEHLMLLGREAMNVGMLVDPTQTFLASTKPQQR